jgi:hypothetical protein
MKMRRAKDCADFLRPFLGPGTADHLSIAWFLPIITCLFPLHFLTQRKIADACFKFARVD